MSMPLAATPPVRRAYRIWGTLLTLFVLAAGFAVFSPTASAHTQKVHDRKGDARFGSREGDIRRVTLQHRNDGTLSFSIKTRARDRHGFMYQGITVKVDGKGLYDIQGVAKENTVMLWEKGKSKPRQTGTARFQERGKQATYTFSAEAIGNPRSFRWRARTFGPDGPIFDQAPNGRRGFAFHDLTKPSTPPGPKPLTIPVTARKAIFQAVCPPGERCKAKVKIEAGKKTYARGSYSVPGGKTRKVRLELTKAGRKKLSSSKRAKAKATITDKRTGKSKSFPVVLRRRG